MYMIKQLFHIDFSKIKDVINEVHKITLKNRIYIFFDLMWCIVFYRAGYTDYLFFDMYKLKHKDRKTILTRGKNNSYIKKLNPKQYWKYIDDKGLFNKKFKKYLGRDYFLLNDSNFNQFKEFLKNKKEIIVKPIDATCGVGVEKIEVGELPLKKLYDKLLSNKQVLIEEVAKQHKDMAKLHPDSINTIRVVTIHNKYDVTTVVAAVVRIGTNHKVVDNFHNGGICAPLDIDRGVINDKAINKDGIYYDKHPTTNVKLVGYKIPNWNKVIKLVTNASKTIPELGIIGWDVCIGPDKPCLIEANQYPAYDLYRMIKIDGSVGIVPLFEKAINKKE